MGIRYFVTRIFKDTHDDVPVRFESVSEALATIPADYPHDTVIVCELCWKGSKSTIERVMTVPEAEGFSGSLNKKERETIELWGVNFMAVGIPENMRGAMRASGIGDDGVWKFDKRMEALAAVLLNTERVSSALGLPRDFLDEQRKKAVRFTRMRCEVVEEFDGVEGMRRFEANPNV